MNFRVLFLGLAALAVALFAILAALLLNQPMPVISPSAPRFADDYDHTMKPSEDRFAVDLNDFESVTVTNTSKALRVEFVVPDPVPEVDFPGVELIRLPTLGHESHSSAADDASSGSLLRLKAIGIGYAPFEAAQFSDYSVRTQLKPFDRNLDPLDEQNAAALFGARRQTVDFRGQFPAVTILMETNGIDSMKFLEIRAFDARTRVDLLTGSGFGGQRFHISPRIWHQGPVDVVFDAAYGPVQRERLDPVPGSTFHFGHGAIRLVAIHAGVSHSSSSGSHGGTNYVEIAWDPNDPDESGIETHFVFLCLPKARNLPLSFEFFDREGNVLAGGGSSSGGLVYRTAVRAAPEQIAALEVSHFPNLKRFVLTLPEIPGLPEENRGVNDLARVRIPWIRFRNEHDFRRTLEALLQIRIRSPMNATIPGSDFPLVFENRTAGDLLDAYLAYYPPMRAVRLDPESFELQIGDSFLKKALVWIRSRLP